MTDSTKNYVLDTNVLIHDPLSMFAFPDKMIIIPLIVIEELDKFKKDQSIIGKNAREVMRTINKLKEKGKRDPKKYGSIKDGVLTKQNAKVKIEVNHVKELGTSLSFDIPDNKILSVAHYYNKNEGETTLLTNDAALAIKAETFGINTSSYKGNEISNIDKSFQGYTEAQEELLYPNQFLIKNKNTESEEITILKKSGNEENYQPVNDFKNIMGIKAKNIEQNLAINLLLDRDVPLVTLAGKAGTGKTLISLAVALRQTLEQDYYSRIIVSRPIIPMGRDLGYLPGSINEKMNPWMQPIFDNLEFIMEHNNNSIKNQSMSFKDLLEGDSSIIKIEPLTYIRGRSIPNQFIVVDEAQNLSLHEVKTILTRIGEGSKVVLCGDPAQIDNLLLDAVSNGFSQIIEKLKDSPLTGHMKLAQGERSPLAELVSDKV